MVFLGDRLLPDRRPAPEQMLTRLTGSELEELYQLRDRLWEARLLPESSLVGKTLAQAKNRPDAWRRSCGNLARPASDFLPNPGSEFT